MIYLLIFILLIPIISFAGIKGYGGVNFSMLSSQNDDFNFIPEFKDDISAIEFGHNIGWSEYIYHALKNRLSNMKKEWHKVAFSGNSVKPFVQQMDRIKTVMEIMEKYKDRAQVGCGVFIGSVPWHKGEK